MSKIIRISLDDPCIELLSRIPLNEASTPWLQPLLPSPGSKELPHSLADTLRILSENLPMPETENLIQSQFTLIAFLLNSLDTPEHASLFVQKLAEIKGRKSLVALALLYDALDFPSLKGPIFQSIVKVAQEEGMMSTILPHLYKLPSASWVDFSLEDFYWELSGYDIPNDLKIEFILKFAELSEMNQEKAENVFCKLFLLSDAAQCIRFLSFKFLNHLQGNAKRLVDILKSGDANAYSNAKGELRTYMEEKGLPEDKCFEAVRLQGLCNLGKEKEEFSIREASEQFQIPEEDLDDWIFRACAVGLMNAKIDQANDKIYTQKASTNLDIDSLKERLAKINL